MRTPLLISVGAVAGANLRYLAGQWAGRLPPTDVPWGTLLVNLSGSLVLGLFMGWAAQRAGGVPEARLLVAVGFCGSYTTFSTFSYEALTLLREGSLATAGGYAAASLVLGLAMVAAGYAAGLGLGRLG